MPINDNTPVYKFNVPAGATINGATFASNGIYTIMPTYTTSNTAISAYPNTSVSWGRDTPQSIQSKETSLTVDKLIESLFRLNPTVKKKYKGDKVKFAEAIVAAAEAVEQRKALTDLIDLGMAE